MDGRLQDSDGASRIRYDQPEKTDVECEVDANIDEVAVWPSHHKSWQYMDYNSRVSFFNSCVSVGQFRLCMNRLLSPVWHNFSNKLLNPTDSQIWTLRKPACSFAHWALSTISSCTFDQSSPALHLSFLSFALSNKSILSTYYRWKFVPIL